MTSTGAHPGIFKEGGSNKINRQKWPILLLLRSEMLVFLQNLIAIMI